MELNIATSAGIVKESISSAIFDTTSAIPLPLLPRANFVMLLPSLCIMQTPEFKIASDHSVLVSFGDGISPHHHERVVRLTTLLLSDRKEFVRNIHPAYSSVLVSFDPRTISFAVLEEYLRATLQKSESISFPSPRQIEIPVCYGGDFGQDLPDVATHNDLTVEQVITIHASGEYLVYFLGFSPGFPYMGGLSEKIATPRLHSPRTKVPAGSVAIGGSQAGIYPVSSPGGWRIIGRTPLKLFRPGENPPTLLQMGDVVRFRAIEEEEFSLMTNV